MNNIEFCDIFELTPVLSNLDNRVYIIDEGSLLLPENDGVWGVMTKEEFSKDSFENVIPDLFMEGHLNYLLNEFLPLDHDVSPDVIIKLKSSPVSHWSKLLDKTGYPKAAEVLKDFCEYMKGNVTLLTEDVIEGLRSSRFDDRISLYIERDLAVRERDHYEHYFNGGDDILDLDDPLTDLS